MRHIYLTATIIFSLITFVVSACAMHLKQPLPVNPKIEKTYTLKVEAADKCKFKQIALTFDDGPDEHVTPAILDILKKEQVKATFFVCGNMVDRYPKMLKRIFDEGHIIANHSWNHPQFTSISSAHIEDQLRRTSEAIQKHVGVFPTLFRLPYGDQDARVKKIVHDNGYHNILWTADTEDWRGKSADAIVTTVKRHACDKGIVLQHNNGKKLKGSVEALPEIIKYLRAQHYKIVTVDEILNCAPYK